ncbi:MAG: endonuclease/exonuclease/phosphatase family protein [Gammaproteobacteria bacterium]
MHLKVLTYNIHKGFSSTNIRFVLHQIKEAINQVHPDLVFLQEIQGEHIGHAASLKNWPLASQFEFLADQLWPHYAYGKNAIYKKGHHGNAILSKFPFVAWENLDVSLHTKASRSVLHGTIQVPGYAKPIHLMCIHFGLFKTERDSQLQKLCDRIASHVPAGEPLIIAGDFNDWRMHAGRFLETHLDLREAFKVLTGRYAKTFPIWRPMLAVDRIYFRDISVSQCLRCTDQPWNRLSDHAALYAEFYGETAL